jgi:hypothetical protein
MFLSFVWKPVNIFLGSRHHSLRPTVFANLRSQLFGGQIQGRRALNNNIETKTVPIGEQWNTWAAKSRKPEQTS